ncbi:ARS binding protein 2-domain-containing protein [Thelonectria olida]|uniref:ARS binding protein 2-domain-containing protein n=1 Tax=Thelonectria olida TaxID=1576542 RepID=A0A9P8WKI5_9HYPO|nr:ARS binding protein 2-domain-containing protein [Thelonectria olida]
MQSANQPSESSQLQTPLQPPKQPEPSTPKPEFPIPPTLPDRDVTAESIEDAYVRFIFYCNPALPLPSETVVLREAFRNPPRSGGKSFNTFAVFELVRKFYDKEIRTWTELTTKLGVEPPDPTKDESAQKIAQYGVRLKKWMNSMHVKAFFEYLMGIPNDYWTNIPTDPNPVAQPIRDGIAVEDDMALRALLPHIRPKRGRKRPTDEEVNGSPAQRTHLSPSSAIEGPTRSSSGLQVPTDAAAAPWTPSDAVQQMPLTRWPQSAITPTCRGSFWDDALEPRSAIVPGKPRMSSQRRGPKNVSSAWRPGASDGGAKMRGRPPINRTPIDTSFPPFPLNTPIVGPGEASTPVLPTPSKSKPATPVHQRIPSPASSSNSQPQSTPQEGSRPPRPSISLQVPERPTGSVRLATPPPPVVLVNGNASAEPTRAPSISGQTNGGVNFFEASRQAGVPGKPHTQAQSKEIPRFHFERAEDRTNIDDVVGQLTQATLEADWRDENGKPANSPSVEEASALVNTTIENMYKTAASQQAFLINLATLSGGASLRTSKTRIARIRTDAKTTLYRCDWEYGFGSLRSLYTTEAQVPLAMFWDASQANGENGPETVDNGQNKLSAGEWQAKYRHLLDNVQKKDRELLDLQNQVMKSLRGTLSKE